ncbi:MAG TPA: hypothetical protein VGV90_01300 [Solirubrobacteraceae bacterium]|nr:hypothetical protein [Solirubrobacteraceae bacterium]
MSEATHPQLSLPRHVRARRAAAVAASSLAVFAVVLTFAFGDARQNDAVSSSGLAAQSSLRSDGGPEEAGVAAAVGARPAPAPDESRIASSIAVR